MDWEAIGAIGEVGGAIAVVATLLLLYRQMLNTITHHLPCDVPYNCLSDTWDIDGWNATDSTVALALRIREK